MLIGNLLLIAGHHHLRQAWLDGDWHCGVCTWRMTVRIDAIQGLTCLFA
jgi:hypothetical protein